MNKTYKEHVPRIGEVYLMRFDGVNSEQIGWRPGLVFQNNVGNAHSPNIIALPLTSAPSKSDLPTHVAIDADDSGLLKDSFVLCENPERMSKSRVGRYITTLSEKYMKQVAAASLIATSAIAFLDEDALLAVWERATMLNTPAT